MADLSRVVVSGPLERFAAGFAEELSRQGFKPVPARQQLELAADLSGWLAAERVAPSGLSLEVAERFCAARRAAGCTSRVTVRALGPLLGYLRGLGVAPAASLPVPDGPVEELLSRFRRYLEQERGLVPAAARGYVDKVRPLRAGATLAEVGQVLRHRRAASTAIYAKVDREALRQIARPWPGAVR